jgi:hypothetical protein
MCQTLGQNQPRWWRVKIRQACILTFVTLQSKSELYNVTIYNIGALAATKWDFEWCQAVPRRGWSSWHRARSARKLLLYLRYSHIDSFKVWKHHTEAFRQNQVFRTGACLCLYIYVDACLDYVSWLLLRSFIRCSAWMSLGIALLGCDFLCFTVWRIQVCMPACVHIPPEIWLAIISLLYVRRDWLVYSSLRMEDG